MKAPHRAALWLRAHYPMLDAEPALALAGGRRSALTTRPSAPSETPWLTRMLRRAVYRLRFRYPMIDGGPVTPLEVDVEEADEKPSETMNVLIRAVQGLRDRYPMVDLDRPAQVAFAGPAAYETAPKRKDRPRLYRRALRSLGVGRVVGGGRVKDYGRAPRYGLLFLVGAVLVWTPIIAYVKVAPLRFSSNMTLILPGQGVSTSLNLSDIGQASSNANSAFSSPTLSPTVLYKNLLESLSVIDRAADAMGVTAVAFGKPVIKLVDETNLIHFEITGTSPENAQAKAEALHAALLAELDQLRDDEIHHREGAATETISDYQTRVESIRAKISELQKASGLTSAEQYGTIVSVTETMRQRMSDTEIALRQKQGAVASLSDMLGVSPELAATTLKAHSDPELQTLAAASAKDESDLADLSRLYGPHHPKVVEAVRRAAGQRAKFVARGVEVTGLTEADFVSRVKLAPGGERSVLLSQLVSAVTERDGLAAQYRSQSEEWTKSQARVKELVETASQLESLNRDFKVADAVFASAIARVNTSKTDIFASYPLVQIAEPADLAEKPSSPNKLIAFGAGGGATFFFAISLALAWIRRPLINKVLAIREREHAKA